MSIISLIAAIDEAGGLGVQNQLLCHLPADLQHFKKMTLGKPIIMGRKTFESIGRPLPGRTNIVLTHKPLLIEGVLISDSLDRAIQNHQDANELIIIGGAEVFKQSLSCATRLYITHIHHEFSADVYFPKIESTEWTSISTEFRKKDNQNPYDLTFCTYERTA